MSERPSRVGLAWYPHLAAGILSHCGRIERIELIEVGAEALLAASEDVQLAMRLLAAKTVVHLRTTTLGIASAHCIDEVRLAALARLIRLVAPARWSATLCNAALATPPRMRTTVSGTISNLYRARYVVGSLPLLETVAGNEPPGSTMDEALWLSSVLRGSGAMLSVDVGSLPLNAARFGHSLETAVQLLDVARIFAVRVRRGDSRALEVLELIAELAPQSLTVIVDGGSASFAECLAELSAARAALRRGRLRRLESRVVVG